MELWNRLRSGRSLEDLPIRHHNGRRDLRGMRVPIGDVVESIEFQTFDVVRRDVSPLVESANWHSLDFASSRLSRIQFMDGSITDCVFDNCAWRHGGFWRSSITDCQFKAADLRNSVLGGVGNGRIGCTYQNVDFTDADLRETVYKAATFIGCTFSHSRLDKVDFQSSRFVNCVFEGELREVLFYRTGFKGMDFPPNEMTGVDLRRATLRWCQFRGLDLDDVLLPEGDDHIIIENFPRTLDRMLKILNTRSDLGSRKLVAVLKSDREWVGPKQHRGVLNKQDLIEIIGEDELPEFIELVESTQV